MTCLHTRRGFLVPLVCPPEIFMLTAKLTEEVGAAREVARGEAGRGSPSDAANLYTSTPSRKLIVGSELVEKWKHRGLPCRILQHQTLLHLNGYVAVPRGHPFWGKHYDDIDDMVVVHGGLTFSQRGGQDPRWPNRNLWWFGFDCAHAGDWTISRPEGHRWTPSEVKMECNQLAEQFILAEKLAKRGRRRRPLRRSSLDLHLHRRPPRQKRRVE